MELHGDDEQDEQPDGRQRAPETLTADLFRKASHESLRILQPFLKALRSNDIDKIKKFEDIEPVLLADAVQEIEAKFMKAALEILWYHSLHQQRRASRRKMIRSRQSLTNRNASPALLLTTQSRLIKRI